MVIASKPRTAGIIVVVNTMIGAVCGPRRLDVDMLVLDYAENEISRHDDTDANKNNQQNICQKQSQNAAPLFHSNAGINNKLRLSY